jgi:hypothetical protein
MFFYRLQQLFILVAHLLLLGWIFQVLNHAGSWTMYQVFVHFTGMAAYGAMLIIGTSFWAKRLYIKEQKQSTQVLMENPEK